VFPYRDENVCVRTPYVTIAIIALCTLTWLIFQGAGSERPLAETVCDRGLIPGELTGLLPPGSRFPMGNGLVCESEAGPHVLNILTSMFLHGSWMHLLGNMWFLWIFGNNVEDSMTRPRFAAFYLLCGLAAALAQVISQPNSVVPMVGASGAISGVMGAYMLLYPKVRVHCFVVIFSISLPAWAMLGYWMVLQLAGGLTQVGTAGGTAFWAHVGGFIAGLMGTKLFVRQDHLAAHRANLWRPAGSWPGNE
jgi:membrane associated rhomboid family serine protease